MTKIARQTEFEPSTTEAWRAKVENGLRGPAFETLIRRTEDGIARGPLFDASDLPQELAHLARADVPQLDGRPWHIAAPVRDTDLVHANAQLLEDLKGGASAVRISRDLTSARDVKRLLEGVFTDLVPLQFTNVTLAALHGVERLKAAAVGVGLNPLSADIEPVPENWRLFRIAAYDAHEAGATPVQELSALAAQMAESCRRHGAEALCRHLVVEIAADRDTHMGIAKTRAARRLILRIADAFGVDATTVPLHAVTSQRMMQTEDAWTNLLRVMSAGFGAIIGGADTVLTRPFTDGLGEATPFAHRIARNMQLLMMEESRLGQVSDPAHGSQWHERMTDELAQAAWRSFQMIERKGGWSAYVESGGWSTALATAKVARAERDAPIIGMNLHRAENVKAPEVRS